MIIFLPLEEENNGGQRMLYFKQLGWVFFFIEGQDKYINPSYFYYFEGYPLH